MCLRYLLWEKSILDFPYFWNLQRELLYHPDGHLLCEQVWLWQTISKWRSWMIYTVRLVSETVEPQGKILYGVAKQWALGSVEQPWLNKWSRERPHQGNYHTLIQASTYKCACICVHPHICTHRVHIHTCTVHPMVIGIERLSREW